MGAGGLISTNMLLQQSMLGCWEFEDACLKQPYFALGDNFEPCGCACYKPSREAVSLSALALVTAQFALFSRTRLIKLHVHTHMCCFNHLLHPQGP
jgi:hypothetical protein